MRRTLANGTVKEIWLENLSLRSNSGGAPGGEEQSLVEKSEHAKRLFLSKASLWDSSLPLLHLDFEGRQFWQKQEGHLMEDKRYRGYGAQIVWQRQNIGSPCEAALRLPGI